MKKYNHFNMNRMDPIQRGGGWGAQLRHTKVASGVLSVQVNFREIPSHVLQKVCMYFTYKVKHR